MTSMGHEVVLHSLLAHPRRPRPSNCPGCPYKSRTCATRGPIDSPFVIVGESPGTTEITKNLPFVGPSGKVLEEALKEGIDPFVTNAVCCLPRNKDLSNLADATSACNQRLIDEIALHPRKVILALGNAAVWSLTGNYNSKISSTRGHVFSSPLAEHGIVACLHPAALMRGFGSSRLFRRDIHLACDLINGYSPYQYVDTQCLVMENRSDIQDLIHEASKQEYIAADLETAGFSPRYNHILSHGFCWDPKIAYIVPPHLAHLIGPIYDPSVVKAKWIWHNGKYDIGMLRGAYEKEHTTDDPAVDPEIRHFIAQQGNRWGYQFARVDEDTMLLSYCIDETQGIHGLEVLANDILGAPNWKYEIDRHIPKKGASYANVPPDVLYLYQAKDLGNTLQIFRAIRPKVAGDPKLEMLYTRHLIAASEELAWMEDAGMYFDFEVCNANKAKYGHHLTKPNGQRSDEWAPYGEHAVAFEAFAKLSTEVLGYAVNPNSWMQVQDLLYTKGLNIAEGKILKTDKDTLRAFPNSPGVKELQKVRKLRKLISTYIEGMEEAVEPDGRIHTTYKLHGTVTGRLASSDPVNLQNIVRNDDIKNQFRAPEGQMLLSVDLSQAELRVLACLSGDKALMDIFKSTVSIHKIVAKKFYGETYSEDQYQLAKAVTFGIVYGRDAFSIAEEYQTPVKEAQAYINNWFGQFPDAKKFIFRCREAPLRGTTLSTPWGRKRRFGIVSSERAQAAGNEAANYPCQSMASDITLETLYTVGPTLRRWGIRPCNIVHDDIISRLAINEDLCRAAADLISKTLIEVPKRRGLTAVPFEAEWKVGTHWGRLTKAQNLPLDFFSKLSYNK